MVWVAWADTIASKLAPTLIEVYTNLVGASSLAMRS